MNYRSLFWYIAVIFICASALAQTRLDLKSQSKSVDFSGASYTRPVKVGTAPPAICTVGDLYFRTDVPAGSNLYACTAANSWTLQSGSTSLPAGTPNGFLSSDGSSNFWRVLTTGGSGAIGMTMSSTDTVIDIDTAVVPRKATGETIDGLWTFSQGVQIPLQTPPATPAPGRVVIDSADNGLKWYAGGAWRSSSGSPGLADPGSDGIVKRSALNTTATAVPGTDYYAPGTAIASADLPNPTASAGGKVQSKTCSVGDFVSAINTDSSVTCGTPSAVSGNYIPFPGSRYARWWIYDTNSTSSLQTGTGMYLTLTATTITSQAATATTRYAARIASSTAANNVAISYSKTIARPVKLPFARWTVSNIPTDGRVWIGFSSAGASLSTVDVPSGIHVAAWRLSATASDTNWQCVVAGGGSTAQNAIVDSGVSGASTTDATDHEFDVRVTATGAIFTLDGVERCNITTPYVPTLNMQAFAAVSNLATGAVKSLDLVSLYTEEDR